MSCQEPSPPHRLGCGLHTVRKAGTNGCPYALGTLKLLAGSLFALLLARYYRLSPGKPNGLGASKTDLKLGRN
jgi:hypothetical protein